MLPTLAPLLSLDQLNPARFDAPAILKQLARSSRALAELKGIAASIPNQGILINTLGLQEAKDSSAIENIVTTHDELFKDDVLPEAFANPAAKEVLRYRQALRVGFEQVRASGLLTANHIIQIPRELERNTPSLRKLPGTPLNDVAFADGVHAAARPGGDHPVDGRLGTLHQHTRAVLGRPVDQDGADPSPVREHPPVL